jgi:hypothetical protein
MIFSNGRDIMTIQSLLNPTDEQKRAYEKKQKLLEDQCMSQELNPLDLFLCKVLFISVNEYKKILSPYDITSFTNRWFYRVTFQFNVKNKIKKLEIIKQKLMKMLNAMDKDIVNKIVKVIISQLLSLFKTASCFIDTYLITKNILTQTTYYKTLTSRP